MDDIEYKKLCYKLDGVCDSTTRIYELALDEHDTVSNIHLKARLHLNQVLSHVYKRQSDRQSVWIDRQINRLKKGMKVSL